jgi:cardiolipin synthase C
MHSPPTPASSAPTRVVDWAFAWRWLLALALSTWTIVGCASLPANVERPVSNAFGSPDQTALGQWVQQRHAQDKARSDSGLILLDSADAAFSSRLALIDAAQRTLDLQYYAIHADATTEILLQRLRDAARRGVRVRILLDDFNTVGKDAQVLRLAFEPNVQMRLFNPLPGSRASLVGRLVTSIKDADRIQKRMHNKLFIADNAMGITGGRNLGDAYFGQDGKSNFVDLEVLAAGRIVRDMSASFDRYWNNELAYPMHSLVSAKELEELRKPASEPDAAAQAAGGTSASASASAQGPSPTPVHGAVLPTATPTAVINAERPTMDLRQLRFAWAPTVLMADQPGKIGPDDDEADARETVVDGLLGLMQQARQDILIVSPYFVPGKMMMGEFAQLRAKGIRIRVLTNSLASTDAPAAHAGYLRYRKQLLSMGVELYEMRADQQGAESGMGSTRGFGSGGTGGGSKGGSARASLHSKALIIDGRLAVIGSMNLDLRSQRKNSEVALLVRSAAIARLATQKVEDTMAHSAYRVGVEPGGALVWHAPPGASFKDTHSEPEADAKLKLLISVLGPFAPEEML